MRKIQYDPTAESYYYVLDSGDELWCDSPTMLADVIFRINERETRREDNWALCVSILIGAAMLAVAAALSAWTGGW